MALPLNGLYLTQQDDEQFTDYFGNLYNGASKCSGCDRGCSLSTEITKNITFVVTEMCNLACTYCYEKHKTKRRMTEEIGEDAVDFLFDKEKLNGYYDPDQVQAVILDFIGGEPLLEIDLIDHIVEYFKFKAFELGHPWAYNYMISISSNGVLYNDEKVQKFMAKNPGKVSFTISIDGNKELHDSCRLFHDGRGSYDIVADAMRNLIAKYPSSAATKMTLAPANVMYLFEAMKSLQELGLKFVFSNCVFEEGWEFKDAQILYDQLIKVADWIIDNDLHDKFYTTLFQENLGQPLAPDQDRNWCGGNGDMLAIGTDGKCAPCLRFMKYALVNQSEICIGDIYNGLQTSDENEWIKRLKAITMSSQSTDKCNNCQIASGCALCTAYNYDRFGDPNIRATFICDTHHARVCANHYFWNKLYKKLGLNRELKLNTENVFESR